MKQLLTLLTLLTCCAITAAQTQQRVIFSGDPPTSCIPGRIYTNPTTPKQWEGKSDGTCVRVDAGAAGGATIPSVTNLIKGDGAGNGADSGIVPANVPLLNAANVFSVSTQSPFFVSAAANPADAGAVRLGNNEFIEWEKAVSGTDWTLGVNASDVLVSSAPFAIGAGSAITSSGAGGALGTAAFQNTGTSGANLPFLNGTNTWSGMNVFNLNTAAAPTPATGAGLQLVGTDATVSRAEVDAFGAIGAFTVRRADGTGASPTALQSGDQIGAFNFHGYYVTGGPAYSGVQASVQGFATQNWTSTANGTKIVVCTTPNSSTTCTTSATFDQDQSATFANTVNATTFVGAVTGHSSLDLALTGGTLSGGLTMNGAAITLSGNQSVTYGTAGIRIKGVAATFNDPLSSGTVAAAYTDTLGGNTLTATGATTITDYNTLNIAPATASTNITVTRKHSIGILDSTSAASSITGGLVVAAAYGTTATSVGIGGGNINAGGTLTVGGHVTLEGVTSAGATGTNNLVFSTSPTLVTPVLGVAIGTSLALGTNPAAAGTLMLPNNTYITARNAANSADINMIQVASTNVVLVGSASVAISLSGLWTTNTGTGAFAASGAWPITTTGVASLGTVSATSTTDATTTTSGALQVAGGAAIRKRVFIDGITASSGLQTAVLCQSSGGEMIADSVACLASSGKVKDNVRPLGSSLNEIMRLRPVSFTYKPEGIFAHNLNFQKTRPGFIAEEVNEIDPRLVGFEKDGITPRTVGYELIVPVLVKAMQELRGIVAGQQKEIEWLRARP